MSVPESRALWAPGSGVSRNCPHSVKEVSRTLWGHFRDVLELGALPGTPRGTLLRSRPAKGGVIAEIVSHVAVERATRFVMWRVKARNARI